MTRCGPMVLTAVVLFAGSRVPVQAQFTATEGQLHTFCGQAALVCGDGSSSVGDLIQASDGNLYGTTETGGANGRGSIFGVSASGAFTTVYSFCSLANCADGEQPEAGLLEGRDGVLYGTTRLGGVHGAGTVFRLTGYQALTVVYSFCSQTNCADGQWPHAALVEDNSGNFYGTAQYGGANSAGTLFQITNSSQFHVLYNFCEKAQCADGALPAGAMVQASNGSLYGATAGKNNGGTIFELSPDGALKTVYTFCAKANCPDGRAPTGRLVQAGNGALFGTTQYGGQHSSEGTVFSITPAGQLTSIYSFCESSNCSDGANPAAGLFLASDGNLYGVTEGGGDGQGTIFKVSTGGSLTTLHSFCSSGNCYDGAYPLAGVTQASDGNFYASTLGGGNQQNAGVLAALDISPTLAGPVTLRAPANLRVGQLVTVSWTTTNAASQTLQNCEAYINSQPYSAVSPSGSAQLSSSYPGTFNLAITCGGTESGVATVTVSSSPGTEPPTTAKAQNAVKFALRR